MIAPHTSDARLKNELPHILSERVLRSNHASHTGPRGFEPRNDGVRVRCLTVWLWATIFACPSVFQTGKGYYKKSSLKKQALFVVIEWTFSARYGTTIA